MKLYTEEQVVRAMSLAVYNKYEKYMEVLDLLTPIELPSDDEIKEASPIVNVNAHDYYFGHLDGFIDGAKRMRDKIQGGNK